MKFKVYAHMRKNDSEDTPFYVGKGSGSRPNAHYKRNSYWKNIVGKNGFWVKILFETDSEQEAFAKEIELIAFYKKQGHCEANFTNGGEGISGWKHDKLTKKKISEASVRNNANPVIKAKILQATTGVRHHHFGKPQKKESLEKAKLTRRESLAKGIFSRKRPVKCRKTGRKWNTITQAAKALGMKPTTLIAQLRGQNPNRTTLEYVG